MNGRNSRDRAAITLGLVSILTVVFVWVRGEVHFVQMPKAGIAVAIIGGLLAVAAGWLGKRMLAGIAGGLFLLAAAAQVMLQTAGSSLANGSNGSTFGLWLGLGAGLVALALTPATQSE
ncbi:MAG TPA: hypothetical protein DGT23_08475 [Micromonosporaceae bacterium]|nr:hypothetical protein [Micromonosporaceae bacterium]